MRPLNLKVASVICTHFLPFLLALNIHKFCLENKMHYAFINNQFWVTITWSNDHFLPYYINNQCVGKWNRDCCFIQLVTIFFYHGIQSDKTSHFCSRRSIWSIAWNDQFEVCRLKDMHNLFQVFNFHEMFSVCHQNCVFDESVNFCKVLDWKCSFMFIGCFKAISAIWNIWHLFVCPRTNDSEDVDTTSVQNVLIMWKFHRM